MENKKSIWAISSLIITFSILLLFLWRTQFIPLRYRLLIAAIIFFVIVLIVTITKKEIYRYVVSVMMLVLCVVIAYSWHGYSNIAIISDYEIIKYHILSSDDINEYHKIGMYKIDENHSHNLQQSIEKDYNVEVFKEYVYLNDLINDLLNHNVDAILMDESYIEDIDIFNFEPNTIKTLKIYEEKSMYDLMAKEVNVMEDPFVVLVSGIETYGNVQTRSRSDLNILMVVQPQNKKVLLITLPKDTYVSLGCEEGAMDKLTHMSVYGLPCSLSTIEKLFDIDVNYFFKINFNGLVDVVDLLDNVDVYSNYDFVSVDGYEFTKGYNTVNGMQALSFVRERFNMPQGDIDRGLHQQELIKAIFTKATSLEKIPLLPAMLNQLQNVINSNFGEENFSILIKDQIEHGSEWEFESIILNGSGDMRETHSQDENFKYYVYIPYSNSVNEIKEMIQNYLNDKTSIEP